MFELYAIVRLVILDGVIEGGEEKHSQLQTNFTNFNIGLHCRGTPQVICNIFLGEVIHLADRQVPYPEYSYQIKPP